MAGYLNNRHATFDKTPESVSKYATWSLQVSNYANVLGLEDSFDSSEDSQNEIAPFPSHFLSASESTITSDLENSTKILPARLKHGSETFLSKASHNRCEGFLLTEMVKIC